MSVCDECKKQKYCSHECRKSKEETQRLIMEAFMKTKAGKMMATLDSLIGLPKY